MRYGRLPIDEQVAALRAVLSDNQALTGVLDRAAVLALPGWYLTAGCVVQTVWNVVTGRQPGEAIRDYDLIYFDRSDLSWDAEDAVIRAGKEIFADLAVDVEIRNEARVHLWYEDRFGVALPPYESTEDAIDSFPATTCCVGIRGSATGRWRVYAPHGLADAFNLVVRPNPRTAPREVYETKTARWQQQWPSLTVLPWP